MNIFAQQIEDKICLCIKENFNKVGIDYSEHIENLETDLIKNEIIEKTISSRNSQIEVYFSNERQTKYKFYLDVYNELKSCFLLIREEKSIEIYQKEYQGLSANEKDEINKMVPIRIIETKPK